VSKVTPLAAVARPSDSIATKQYSRRQMLGWGARVFLIGTAGLPGCTNRKQFRRRSGPGAVIGEAAGAAVGQQVLAEGGNAIDAAIAAALTSCVAAPSRCGIGGYGGHMTIALAAGPRITSIDFNSTAPAAAREDMYPLNAKGEVEGKINLHGWLAAGVPGTLAGLQFALDRFGTRSFRELVQPAIRVAENGLLVSSPFAASVRGAMPRFRSDPGSAKLYLPDGKPPNPGETLRNPDLARLLSTLAQRNSVESFYRGDIAQRIAEAFQKSGGLVSAEDLAAYQAREVKPLSLQYGAFNLFTAPLTAGGLTVFQALSVLKALKWKSGSPAATHARLEALRLAWKDRLDWLGDPEHGSVPVQRLLSAQYAAELAARVSSAVHHQTPLSIQLQSPAEDGTTHISSVDPQGNMVALTLTHGGSFGAQVTVDGLGLTLGHGMSRFNPRPGHPNSPGARKRPLHNMCPSIVLRNGKPILALGAAGGVRIPNAVYHVLTQYLVHGDEAAEAVGSPRLHCTGTLNVGVETGWPASDTDYLKRIGFEVNPGSVANLNAVSFDPRTGACQAVTR
jgi:gamma-glutamyltranspeptidase / glutathione hydrolase